MTLLSGGSGAPLFAGVIEHPALGQVRYEAREVSDDPDTQVEQVISLMRGYAVADASSPAIAADVQRAWRSDDPLTDTWDYLNRWSGTRGMLFVQDEATGEPFNAPEWRPVVETLMRPADQANASQPQGDCDDFAMLGASHLLARGVPCAFVTVAADERDPRMYSHVYLVAYPITGLYAGQRVPLDLSHGESLGWETANKFGKRREWPLQGSDASERPMLLTAVIAAILLYAGYHMWKKGTVN